VDLLCFLYSGEDLMQKQALHSAFIREGFAALMLARRGLRTH
jgi:hypothetical protein